MTDDRVGSSATAVHTYLKADTAEAPVVEDDASHTDRLGTGDQDFYVFSAARSRQARQNDNDRRCLRQVLVGPVQGHLTAVLQAQYFSANHIVSLLSRIEIYTVRSISIEIIPMACVASRARMGFVI